MNVTLLIVDILSGPNTVRFKTTNFKTTYDTPTSVLEITRSRQMAHRA